MTIEGKLNSKIETMFMLGVDDFLEEKSTIIKGLDEFGIEGKNFYNQHCHILERYYGAFQKHRVDSEGSSLLRKMQDAMVILAYIFWKHPEWFEHIGDVEEAVVCSQVDEMLTLATESSDLVSGLEEMGLSAESKWQIMLLKQQPKKQLMLIGAAVMENLSAWQIAWEKVAGQLEVLLTAFLKKGPKENRILKSTYEITSDAVVLPSLAHALGYVGFENLVVYGLLIDVALDGTGEFTKEEMMIGAKVLSEKSKLEILLALKDHPMYSSQIAEQVGLTPATVSHHMNGLLVAGFVVLERRESKSYYQLAIKGIQRFVEGTQQLLY